MSRYETPSPYLPAGASFNGAGSGGIGRLIEAADAAGAGWTAALDQADEHQGYASFREIEANVHSRIVDGETIWGLLVEPSPSDDS